MALASVSYCLIFSNNHICHFDTEILSCFLIASLYHAQAVRWYEEYGVVKGLGNLQWHFAYNSSYFAFAALFSLEPNRYRPSSEALCRRAVKGMELYRINALVDLINVLSLLSGYSIGGFDASKIDGDVLTLGVGREGEPFEAIGRGMLNICGMPVYRDNTGGIGTPTSDNERTKLDLSTTRLLMCINIYGEEMPADDAAGMAVNLLEKYAEANNITINYYRP